MKVLNICCDDYANFSHDNANSLRSVGIDCIDIKVNKHVFGYLSESTIASEGLIKLSIKQANIVQIFHSDYSLVKYCAGKKIVVYHTGTRYRQNPEKYNALFNPIVERSFIALGEFAGLGAKNEEYLVGAIAIEDKPLEVVTKNKGKLIFAHYPSNPIVKGTDKINAAVFEAMKSNSFVYHSEVSKVTHAENIERMKLCDIYIELYAYEQGGKPYGSWGITALEAAALGKVVITNHLTVDVYKKTYGIKPALILIEEQFNELSGAIANVCLHSPIEVVEMQQNAQNWVKNNHSYSATGLRLKTILDGL